MITGLLEKVSITALDSALIVLRQYDQATVVAKARQRELRQT